MTLDSAPGIGAEIVFGQVEFDIRPRAARRKGLSPLFMCFYVRRVPSVGYGPNGHLQSVGRRSVDLSEAGDQADARAIRSACELNALATHRTRKRKVPVEAGTWWWECAEALPLGALRRHRLMP